MILRAEEDPEEVFLLQLTDDGLINMRRWSTLRNKQGTSFDKMAYRQLIWERPSSALQEV